MLALVMKRGASLNVQMASSRLPRPINFKRSCMPSGGASKSGEGTCCACTAMNQERARGKLDKADLTSSGRKQDLAPSQARVLLVCVVYFQRSFLSKSSQRSHPALVPLVRFSPQEKRARKTVSTTAVRFFLKRINAFRENG